MKKGSINHSTIRHKFNFLMKSPFILLIILFNLSSTLFVNQASSQTLDKFKISLHIKKLGIKESLLAVEKQSKMHFSLPDDLLGNYPKSIEIDANEISVKKAIEIILSNTDLQYRVLNNYILIEPKKVSQGPGKIIGEITDLQGSPLPGAIIRIVELNKSFSNNPDGSYSVNVKAGIYSIEVIYTSYNTQLKTAIIVEEGKNTSVNFVLKEGANTLNEVVVTTQKRSEKLLDVPIAVTSLGAKQISQLSDNDLTALSTLMPGLNIIAQSIQHPLFAIRGIFSDDYGAYSRSRLSVYHNGVPISRSGGSALEVYDMSIEAIKGPQGTIFGQGSLVGGLSYRSNMPENRFETTAGLQYGNYNQKLTQFVLNTPIVKDKLLLRVGGIYDTRDGYVKNTFGGTLLGKGAAAAKAYLTYFPSSNTQIHLMYDYENDNTPGISVYTKLPNQNGVSTDPYTISAPQGRNLAINREIHEITTNINHRFTDELNLTSLSSFRYYNDFEWYAADGAATQALNFITSERVRQLYQEIRLNYTGHKFKSFGGITYVDENMHATRTAALNEQSLFWLFSLHPEKLVNSDGTPNLATTVPDLPGIPAQMAGMALPSNRQETLNSNSSNRSLDYFIDGTYNITPKLSITAGGRVTQEFLNSGYEVTNNNVPSVAYQLLSSLDKPLYDSKSFFYKPSPQIYKSGNFNSFTGRFIVQYKFNQNSNTYASISTGRRPPILQFSNDGIYSQLNAEKLTNYELGYKNQLSSVLYFDVAAYTYKYSNIFLKSQQFGQPFTGVDNGKATSYGIEMSIRSILNKNVSLSANYAFSHARFDKIDAKGNLQQFAGQPFHYSPDHAFNLMADITATINRNAIFFITPSYSFKSKYALFDNVTWSQTNLFQSSVGLANLITGIRFDKPNITASLFSNNIFNKKYFENGASTGKSYGLPGYVPAIPVTYGIKFIYTFLAPAK